MSCRDAHVHTSRKHSTTNQDSNKSAKMNEGKRQRGIMSRAQCGVLFIAEQPRCLRVRMALSYAFSSRCESSGSEDESQRIRHYSNARRESYALYGYVAIEDGTIARLRALGDGAATSVVEIVAGYRTVTRQDEETVLERGRQDIMARQAGASVRRRSRWPRVTARTQRQEGQRLLPTANVTMAPRCQQR